MRTEVTPASHRAGGPAGGNRVQAQLLPLSLRIGRNATNLERQLCLGALGRLRSDSVTGADVAAQTDLVASGPLSGSGLMRAMERAASTTTSSTGQTESNEAASDWSIATSS
jgi:hypothetical protein